MELYLDFLMWGRTLAPVRMPGSNHVAPDYRWRTSDPLAQVLPSQLGKDVNTWTVAFKYLCRKGIITFPFQITTHAQSIRRIGLLMKHGGVAHRPLLLHGIRGPQWLQHRLRGTSSTQRTLKFPLLVIPESN